MSPSTAKLLRAAVAHEIAIHENMQQNNTAFPTVSHELASILRHVRRIVQPPEGMPLKGAAPTDSEIEAEVKAQLAERAAEAFCSDGAGPSR